MIFTNSDSRGQILGKIRRQGLLLSSNRTSAASGALELVAIRHRRAPNPVGWGPQCCSVFRPCLPAGVGVAVSRSGREVRISVRQTAGKPPGRALVCCGTALFKGPGFRLDLLHQRVLSGRWRAKHFGDTLAVNTLVPLGWLKSA